MNNTPCSYCGSIHNTKCPLIKSIEYNPDGTTKRVEFYAPIDYRPLENITFGPDYTPISSEQIHRNAKYLSEDREGK